MGLLSRLFGKKDVPQQPELPDHAVMVHFIYGSTELGPLFALEEELGAAISSAGVGIFDGDEIAIDGSDGRLYMYGPDADRLLEVVKPILESTSLMSGARVTVRHGPPQDGVPETELTIGG